MRLCSAFRNRRSPAWQTSAPTPCPRARTPDPVTAHREAPARNRDQPARDALAPRARLQALPRRLVPAEPFDALLHGIRAAAPGLRRGGGVRAAPSPPRAAGDD